MERGATRRGLIGLVALGCEAALTRASFALSGEAGRVPKSRLRALVAAYPDHLSGIEGDMLVWRDGTKMPIGNDKPERPFAEMLRDPTLADQLRQTYTPGRFEGTPPRDHSPGRLRHTPFFTKMYGDCRKGALRSMGKLVWMPKTAPQKLPVTTVNDVAGRLERMQDELEGFSAHAKSFLVPSAGTDVCRPVLDTGQLSMHAYAAAIDLNVKKSDYWAWHKPYRPSAAPEMPHEIIALFERNGFIWGGKWYHYDSMHFEYRPELLAG